MPRWIIVIPFALALACSGKNNAPPALFVGSQRRASVCRRPRLSNTLPGTECLGCRSRWRWCSGRSWVRGPRADGRIAGEEGERNY
jgi:hypothetical protein